MNEYENAIGIKGVTKRYDGFTLDNISFDVPKGCIMGFIGQNGAGKTTTIRSLLHITNINSGEISLLGMDHVKDEAELKKRIAVVFDELPFHDMFNVKDMAKIFRGLYPDWNDETYMKYIDRFQLPKKKKIGQFSKGMKMKLQIACALSHNAELLVMDEATTGLDPVVRDEILHIFMEYLSDGEHSILMSSHITSDLEKIADMVTFIDKGRILLTGYKDEILESHGILRCAKDYIQNVDPEDIVSVRTNNFGAEIMVNDRESAKMKYRDTVIDPASLDDIMLYYVHRDAKEWS
ncbi:ABC transporter ATP-binding protein [Ruminococcus sp.]|uniref:ABC transporter ATP-binding protein n=1 Tax=Ruminococcus sp. TaxID=41978 RepID=UPI002B685D7D|nr:ABC transporter ATP-binding protein [Ruminococcus sp.]HNZ98465.1 ABC transporter ATP-binding protein [Ruminococcus sp.]HOH85721.1 ABC transporter ATP-binding protein [Ruminococcus sp.]